MRLDTLLAIMSILVGVATLYALAIWFNPDPTPITQAMYAPDKSLTIEGTLTNVKQGQTGITGDMQGTCSVKFYYYGEHNIKNDSRAEIYGTLKFTSGDPLFFVEELRRK